MAATSFTYIPPASAWSTSCWEAGGPRPAAMIEFIAFLLAHNPMKERGLVHAERQLNVHGLFAAFCKYAMRSARSAAFGMPA